MWIPMRIAEYLNKRSERAAPGGEAGQMGSSPIDMADPTHQGLQAAHSNHLPFDGSHQHYHNDGNGPLHNHPHDHNQDYAHGHSHDEVSPNGGGFNLGHGNDSGDAVQNGTEGSAYGYGTPSPPPPAVNAHPDAAYKSQWNQQGLS